MNITGTFTSPLDRDFVEKLLPQKFPFVMVDKMYAYNETSLIAGLTIEENNLFFHNGNFVESGLIEHIAQSIALHTGYQFFLQNEIAPTGYIGSIKDIEIIRLPQLGDKIQTTITIIQEFAGITLVNAVTKLNNTIIASGQMKTVLAK